MTSNANRFAHVLGASLVASLVAACGYAPDADGDGLPAVRSTPPAEPAGDDPAFVLAHRSWLMAGDGLTPRDDLAVTVGAPAGTRFVDAWIDAGAGARLVAQAD